MKTYQDEGNYDIVESFTERWNKRVRKLRITGIIGSILMIVLGILLCINPEKSISVIETIADCIIIAAGIYQIADYSSMPVLFQSSARIASGILNILIGIFLLYTPNQIQTATFTFLFGILLLIWSADLLSLSRKLSYFNVSGHGWVIAAGIIAMVTSVMFLCMPFVSAVALNYVLAGYLIADGIALLIEMLSMKDLKIKE